MASSRFLARASLLPASATAAVVAVLILMTFTPHRLVAAPSPSFSCSNSLSADEAAICSDAELSNLDVTMASRYRSLLASEPQQQEWRDSQGAWLQRRGACGDDKVCLRQTYLDRIDVLDRRLKEVAPRPAASQALEIDQSCTRNAQCATGHCEFHGSKGYVCAVAAAPGQPVVPAARGDDVEEKTFLQHNGSTITMTRRGHELRMFYSSVRPGLSVEEGTLLFNGTIDDSDQIKGAAYTFRRGCPAAPYEVHGAQTYNEIELHGPAPVRDSSGCDVVDYDESAPGARLTFDIAE